ncbi:MAG: formate dehydrogenase accessory protein FdhE [Desulfitobacteriaceae bacterium]
MERTGLDSIKQAETPAPAGQSEPENSEVYTNYRTLQAEVEAFLTEKKDPAPTSAASLPYFPLHRLPFEEIGPLWQRLNTLTGISLSEAELTTLWTEFTTGVEVSDPRVYGNLQLAWSGLARWARSHLTAEQEMSLGEYEGQACPICGETSPLSVLVPPNGKRHLHCQVCGHSWPAKRVGCVRCGEEDAKKQSYLQAEGFPGIEIVVCEACGDYFKEVDLRQVTVEDMLWEDIRTLPLNYAAEKWLVDKAKEQGKLQ